MSVPYTRSWWTTGTGPPSIPPNFCANGERIARKDNNGTINETYYYHSDHLHSTSVVTKKGRLMADTISVDYNWLNISLPEQLNRPVVVSKVMTQNNGDNCEERIKSVTHDSFQVMIEETPKFLPNEHATETMGYMALEEGLITDGGEEIGEAGTIYAGDQWTRVTFQQRMDAFPVVIASSMSVNDSSQGVVRIRNIGINGFDVRFEEYSGVTGHHELEKIGWVAMKPGEWTLDGETVVVGKISNVTRTYNRIDFPEAFGTVPVALAQIQSYNESDLGSHVRQNNPTVSSFKVKIEEENDTPHTGETVGYIAMEPATLKSGAAKIGETKYYPYGVVQEGGDEKYLYTGKELDKGTGLYYYEMRYYNPKTGRFIQADLFIPDPYNPQSLNRYAYVLNNPLRYVDPTGEAYEEGLIASGAMILGGVLLFIGGGPVGMYVGAHMVVTGMTTGGFSLVISEDQGEAIDKTIEMTKYPFASSGTEAGVLAVTGDEEKARKGARTMNNVLDGVRGANTIIKSPSAWRKGLGIFSLTRSTKNIQSDWSGNSCQMILKEKTEEVLEKADIKGDEYFENPYVSESSEQFTCSGGTDFSDGGITSDNMPNTDISSSGVAGGNGFYGSAPSTATNVIHYSDGSVSFIDNANNMSVDSLGQTWTW